MPEGQGGTRVPWSADCSSVDSWNRQGVERPTGPPFARNSPEPLEASGPCPPGFCVQASGLEVCGKVLPRELSPPLAASPVSFMNRGPETSGSPHRFQDRTEAQRLTESSLYSFWPSLEGRAKAAVESQRKDLDSGRLGRDPSPLFPSPKMFPRCSGTHQGSLPREQR